MVLLIINKHCGSRNWRFNPANTKAHYWAQYWTSSIHLWFILMLSSHLLVIHVDISQEVSSQKFWMHSISPILAHCSHHDFTIMTILGHLNKSQSSSLHTILNCSLTSSFLSPKYFLEHFNFKHLQSLFFVQTMFYTHTIQMENYCFVNPNFTILECR